VEVERRRHGHINENINENLFIRHFHPQMIEKEKWNDDQPFQPPLRNDNMLDDYIEE